jgi:Tfp pilus assembly protein PilW
MTVIELMAVLLVFSLIMGAVSSLLITSLAVYSKGSVSAQAQASVRIALSRLVREVRQARRLINGTAEPVNGGTFTFETVCGPAPEISFALPHTAVYALSDGSSAYATDANALGVNPYDGWYVSYYLSAAQSGTGPLPPAADASGPYVIRVQYDVSAGQLSYGTVAGGVTALTVAAQSSCPTVGTRTLSITVAGTAAAVNEAVSTTDVVTSDVTLRNQ